jgi:hypothetical protein
MGPNLVAIDLFGPWAAFGNAGMGPTMGPPLFNLWCAAATTDPIDVDGLMIRPQYSFASAP